MKDNYIKILDSFKFREYIEAKQIKRELKESDHIEATKIIKKYAIAQPYDYIRACGKSNFTDFALNKLEKRTEDDSKYIISRYVDGKVIYLYTNKLFEKLQEMKWLVSKGYFDTIQSRNKKIKGYFKDENEITIGKKSIGEIKILLEEADINSIVTRKYYLFDKNHLSIQSQLGALGVYFGYKSKLAQNDKNKEIYGVNLNTVCVATIKDIDLSNLKSEKSLEKIDYVDVIWTESVSNNFTVAIEIEFKEDWLDAIVRLVSVSLASRCANKVINVIISEKQDDFFTIRDIAKMDMISSLPAEINLAHMTTQKLIEILEMRDNGLDAELVKKRFFNELRYI
ncbi:hypothetical protein [Clostridium tetani]|uniref:hypothetical protein n=1 Tax=Clostridium tetani TaxID=1513 RepID=UPI00100B6023|nr:hypothetical protein [Clostridium tetani]RXM59314.1 hypothetical protein DP133_00285 [Clostridium tetani]RXM74071.1 hypothetical protein DP154_13240 [Clostridium tetani]RYU97973.1 hypothetical protein DP144_13000 [Clostridium tetani]